MFRKHWDKMLFVLGLLALAFAYGVATAQLKIPPYGFIRDGVNAARDWRDNWETLLDIRPGKFLRPAVYEGQGVTRFERPFPQRVISSQAFTQNAGVR